MAQQAESKKSRRKWNGAVEEFFDWVETTLLCMILAIVVLTYLFQEVQVDGTSMVPTLQDGDRLVTSSLFYTVEPGDIVVINREDGQEPLIKRCIAVAGQTVDIDFDTGIVSVDGVALDDAFKAGHAKSYPAESCVTCHHYELAAKDWGHQQHSEEFGVDCTSCHHADTDIARTAELRQLP